MRVFSNKSMAKWWAQRIQTNALVKMAAQIDRLCCDTQETVDDHYENKSENQEIKVHSNVCSFAQHKKWKLVSQNTDEAIETRGVFAVQCDGRCNIIERYLRTADSREIVD